ncbi:hypothetical protein RHMOL_Rhmol04G0379900 [Rhododendron molle]|uniref:Uncharacterized protein n=1 Tax=Rhododendron molle TaxID=49168 RepID=A0ACC0P8T2_RHOML|nr:hypothetical protein RHMOL_Rhmol04G0379900 [Rhododendron molle]
MFQMEIETYWFGTMLFYFMLWVFQVNVHCTKFQIWNGDVQNRIEELGKNGQLVLLVFPCSSNAI